MAQSHDASSGKRVGDGLLTEVPSNLGDGGAVTNQVLRDIIISLVDDMNILRAAIIALDAAGTAGAGVGLTVPALVTTDENPSA